MIGRAIGHYVINEPLAQGGMGIVYKAHDVRLGRDVVLKALRPDRDTSPERIRRFLEEARSISALSHPNIVTVYDILTDDDSRDYIVMEHVPGRTASGPLPWPELLGVAMQIADALAAAHAHGIVHRDLKPANILVTDQGSVKLLDFGLARLNDDTETLDHQIVGTVSYMAPEQAAGRRVDHRADIFSFGCILYELATGQRAFQTILRDEPPPPSKLVPTLPARFDEVVARCLHRDPAQRYQSMAEAKAAVESLRERPRRRGLWLLAIPAVLALVLFFRPSWRGQESWQVVPLTTYAGHETQPALSPDGKRVAFIWDGDVPGQRDLYVREIGKNEPLRLTSTTQMEYSPAWSPDARLLSFVTRDGVFVVPAAGGAPTRISNARVATDSPARWSPDGAWLAVTLERNPDAIALLPAGGGELRLLTDPEPSYDGDTRPAFSSDGETVYFIRRRNVWNHAVYSLQLTDGEEPRRLTDWNTAYRGFDVLRESLIACGTVGARYLLLRVPIRGGAPEPLAIEPISAINPSVAGGRLVYERTLTDINLWMVPGPADGSELREPVRLVASTYIDREAAISPDGTRIVFVSTRSGGYEVWTAAINGSNQRQVTSFGTVRLGSPTWAPDSKRVAFDAYTGGKSDIWIADPKPRKLTDEPGGATRPDWSADGHWIYYSTERGISRVPVEGGPATVVSRFGGLEPRESPDGRWLYFFQDGYVWQVRPDEWPPRKVAPAPDEGAWALAGSHLYVRTRQAITRYHAETHQAQTVYQFLATEPEPPRAASIAVSPDERTIVYARTDRTERDIMLVEDFWR